MIYKQDNLEPIKGTPTSVAFPLLARPVKIGAIEAKNSVFMASLTRNRSVPDTFINEHNVKYYVQRAGPGGAGLILTEATLVSRQGTGNRHAPGIWDEEHAAGWKTVVDAVHAEGTPIVAQLWHVGRLAHPDMDQQIKAGRPVYGPSDVGARGGKFRLLPGKPGYITNPEAHPDPMTIIDEFEHAAKMAKLAGFDGVEFHSANGYIGEQFLSDISNTRTDEYGGSIENRAKLGLEVMKRLIKVYGADRVGVKLSPAGGFNDIYFSSPEMLVKTYEYYITELDKLNIAFMEITQYNDYGDPKHEGIPQGYDHDVVATYGHLITKSNLIANMNYDGASGEKEIRERGVKAISYGRKFIANPDYYRRLQEGLPMSETDQSTLYYGNDGDPGKGYHDYAFAGASA